jgi:diguanylate cyclase
LLRWTPAGRDPVPPGRFIPLAEASGAILPIGAWVLERVCADLREWYPRHGISVTANVSARQLRDPEFAANVLRLLREAQVPGAALILEITETVLATSVADVATVAAQLQALRDVGVRIAVDDFGTGYSSLSYLGELPVDVLKMAGSFTAEQMSRGRPPDLAFVRAIVDLARSLGLPVVAEAVETAEQAARLRELGCELGQGYLFARPAPAIEFEQQLRQTVHIGH